MKAETMNVITKTLARITFAVLAALSCLPAMAGSFNGSIVTIDVRANGLTTVYMSGTTGHGACSGASQQWAIKDETSVAGKTQLAVLMGAFLSGRTVTVYGVNTCTRSTGIEDIDEVTPF